VPENRGSAAARAIDTGESRALGYGGFPSKTAITCCARSDRRVEITRGK